MLCFLLFLLLIKKSSKSCCSVADISCGAQTGPMLLWHHLEVQRHHTPQREAGLHSHPMPHCYRSAQVTGAGVATEHALSTGTRAKRYYRRCIATEADATFRPHGRSCHNPRRTQGKRRHAHRRCSPGGRKQADRQHYYRVCFPAAHALFQRRERTHFVQRSGGSEETVALHVLSRQQPRWHGSGQHHKKPIVVAGSRRPQVCRHGR